MLPTALADVIDRTDNADEHLDYREVLAVIEKYYAYRPTAFHNGGISNAAGSNEISCKIFSFALLHDLNKEQTLACFGQLYFDEVLANPSGQGHQNIRQFMKTGWQGIQFLQAALQEKNRNA